jgi:hypothetical protein
MFRAGQNFALKQLKGLCQSFIGRSGQQIAPGTVVAFAGSWSRCRREKEYVLVLIDLKQEKMFDCQKASNNQPGSQSHLESSGSELEMKSLKRKIPRWKGRSLDHGILP